MRNAWMFMFKRMTLKLVEKFEAAWGRHLKIIMGHSLLLYATALCPVPPAFHLDLLLAEMEFIEDP